MSALSRQKDAEMSKRLAPSPKTHRFNPERWPYHNNLGTAHKKPTNLAKKEI